jgi:hypothetical protein
MERWLYPVLAVKTHLPNIVRSLDKGCSASLRSEVPDSGYFVKPSRKLTLSGHCHVPG